ncbi:hypothetical protein [Conexibacter woesei]|uniref:Uncharacterized protein n=1 Tax=Conexibacter woesei (strain DSM 14684 / CCUG 47730 / CIP 108061 / JCM 11494 / NBRC 100937 / ID131577) TaxID=469383 RepID=D3F5L9_CONWI|nr:hypothetical protein [Conexibacter woesei]ADB52568.1 hypothetical protein Cwoe_4153 [Conexibacter woesei DSM 14684]
MKRLIAAVAASIALLSLVAVAAGSGRPSTQGHVDENLTARVLYDCATSHSGRLQHRYSVRVLRVALRDMPRDVAEYTGCIDAIRRQISRADGTIVAGLRRSARGRLVAGRIALLDQRGRKVDVLEVERGELARFRVVPGQYTLRANGERRCSRTVRASEWRTSVSSLVCRR